MASTTRKHMSFVSLGMVVLDELRRPSHPPQHDVLGGSGAYSMLEARLAAGPAQAAEVGCFIMAEHDFPEDVLHLFREWGVELVVKADPTRESTRGVLECQDEVFGKKTFHYKTAPIRPSPADLPAHFLEAASFHLLAQPEELAVQIQQLRSQKNGEPKRERPLLVWEPFPPTCNTGTRDQHLTAAKLLNVFSPNHLELMAFFHDFASKEEAPKFDSRTIEAYAAAFLDSSIGPTGNGTVVIRAGEHGCLVASNTIGTPFRWLPPCASEALDATGAGNTFLGAYTFAMASGKDPLESAATANVAASFALQQIGFPQLRDIGNGQETWNGNGCGESYDKYLAKISTNLEIR
ncbi:carbohydrate/purine kinase [Xylariaceae sp. FL1272]|nr:carbohydrate/purine kinase [Xylariaceae sp. FL1272]